MNEYVCADNGSMACYSRVLWLHSLVGTVCTRAIRSGLVTNILFLYILQGYKELYTKKWAFTQELAVSIDAGKEGMGGAERLCRGLWFVGGICVCLWGWGCQGQ